MSFNEFQTEGHVAEFGPLIPWGGGDRPVSGDTLVRVHFRNRRPYVGPAHGGLPDAYQPLMWQWAPQPRRENPDNDIIAYQVLNG